MRARPVAAPLLCVALGMAMGCMGCKGPLAKIDAVRDALTDDDTAAILAAGEAAPACPEPFVEPPEHGCFRDMATGLGSKTGFNLKQPDQAAAATVALIVAREKRGDWVPQPDTWLALVRTGKGPGPDALRLAIARQMAAAAADVGKAIEAEADAVVLLKGIAAAIPGACATYAALGSGVKNEALPLTAMPDHSPCVQKDLGRPGGPGATYGRGTWRAAAGAVALWKDEAAALREGLSTMSGKRRSTLEAKLAGIDAATAKVTLKKVEREVGWLNDMSELHGDAGVPLELAADSGAPAPSR